MKRPLGVNHRVMEGYRSRSVITGFRNKLCQRTGQASRRLTSPNSKMHFSLELLFNVVPIFRVVHVAKKFEEFQFCEHMSLPSPCSFFSGCVATSPSKNGLHSSIPSPTHSIIYLAGAVSELGEGKGRILQGWQRALTSREGMLFQLLWGLLVGI